jgi:hypothetical protein
MDVALGEQPSQKGKNSPSTYAALTPANSDQEKCEVTVTLIMGVFQPSHGAWLSADHRVTWPKLKRPHDDNARKVLAMLAADGYGMLAFTGLAAVHPSDTHMIDWLRSELSGTNRTFKGHIEFLASSLSRKISASPYGNDRLDLLGVALERGEMWRYRISNGSRPDGTPTAIRRRFDAWGWPVVQPTFDAGGSGLRHITQEDVEKVEKIVKIGPRDFPEDYHRLLAAINRRVAMKAGTAVTAWCDTTHMTLTGSFNSLGHRAYREPDYDIERPMPFLLNGLDLTDLKIENNRQFAAFNQENPTSEPSFFGYRWPQYPWKRRRDRVAEWKRAWN